MNISFQRMLLGIITTGYSKTFSTGIDLISFITRLNFSFFQVIGLQMHQHVIGTEEGH